MKTGVLWFGQDLRLSDHKLLAQAAMEMDYLICVYCFEPERQRPSRYATQGPGNQRTAFLIDSLQDMEVALGKRGQTLYVSEQSAYVALSHLFDIVPVSHLYRNYHPGIDERRTLDKLQQAYPDIKVRLGYDLTLFRPEHFPFDLEALPTTFSAFRRKVEELPIHSPLPAPETLPPPAEVNSLLVTPWDAYPQQCQPPFEGGERAALTHLSDYFATDLPSYYKDVRNALDGWENSTKFSPWLAHGNLSPRQIKACLEVYERDHGANDSTYWIYFELLWREYFHWYAARFGVALFRRTGITGKGELGSYYPERFRKWCEGNTPYPIVNACMKQLNETGFMSNRGRQLVASCLIYELGIDWRYGAAYFEQKLIDYDVGSNWGNWQYIAGVGADPRGGRHFNLDKQTQMYDPEQRFIRKWRGEVFDRQLDSVDAADWPIAP
jgi:deoxyribodipyrimidine photo-lyase